MSSIAFISHGKMHLLLPGQPPAPVESKFGERMRARAAGSLKRNAWKTEGFSARFQGRRPQVTDPELLIQPARITSIGPGTGKDGLLYTLESDGVCGLFAVRDSEETRLFHGSGQYLHSPAAHPSGEFIACAVSGAGGSSHIAVMRGDGGEVSEVTEGDSADGSPAWVPGQPSQLLYQSAGVGRDEAGRFRGFGPSAIQRIDFATRKTVTVREEPGHDLVSPRGLPDGSVLFMRRPWRNAAVGINPWRAGLNLLLIPWNLVRAVWGWLSFFAIRYTGKPLVRAGTPDEEKQDMREMLVLGNLLDAAQAPDKRKPLVPQTWELVKLSPGGETAVLARSVLSFDVGGDGTIVVTDGAAIDELGADGSRRTLHAASAVQQVTILP